MESEFVRVLIPVLIAGLLIVGVGTTLIILVMRGLKKEGEQQRTLLLAGSLIAFLAICCAVFLALSRL